MLKILKSLKKTSKFDIRYNSKNYKLFRNTKLPISEKRTICLIPQKFKYHKYMYTHNLKILIKIKFLINVFNYYYYYY